MRVLALEGQRNAAITYYNNFCQVLEEELGVAPEQATRALAERITNEEGLSPEKAAPAHNLPAIIVPLVGRKREISEIRRQLLDPYCKLLTLVGPGGSGKTHLAIDIARSLVGRFAQGIFFLPLSTVASVDSLMSNLTKTLGLVIQEKRPAKDQLLDYLRQKDMLLLLDSFEGIMEGIELVIEILKTAPGLKILATSRQVLNIQDECLFPLEGLEYDRAEYPEESAQPEAVQLFLAGARRIQPAFELSPKNQDDIIAICRLVQGIPLAILLAATWVMALSPVEILEKMRTSFAFLEADWADIPPRQRSLRATFDYSWSLLKKREQILFQMLSIFQGGFTYQAAEQVTGATLQELRTLIGKSFLGYSSSGRYSMHDMLRQYGVDKLMGIKGSDTYHDLHSNYYLKLIASREGDLKGAQQQAALNELDPELANIRSAWDWAVDQGDVEILGESIESLCVYYEMRFLYQEGERACRLAAEMIEARECSTDRIKTLIRMRTWQARFHRLLGNTDRIQTLHQDCRERLEELSAELEVVSEEKAFLFLEMGNAVLNTNHEAAKLLYQESVEIYRALEDDWWAANVFFHLGEVNALTAKFSDAIASYEYGLALFHSLGDPRGVANALTGLGFLLYRVGRVGEGEKCVHEMIELFEELGDRGGIARSQLHFARVFFLQGRYIEITELFTSCNPLLKDLGLQYDRAHLLGLSSISYSHLGICEMAKLHAEELLLLSEQIDYPRFFATAHVSLGMNAVINRDYNLACIHFQRFVDIEKKIGNPDERSAGIGCLGGAYLKAGDLPSARQNLYEAMQVIIELKAIWGASWTLPWVALYLAKRGDVERAVEVYAIASNLPIVANSKWFEEVAEADIIAACVNLPNELIVAARERGKKADLFATAAELLEELKE